jgi:hypothetical protein
MISPAELSVGGERRPVRTFGLNGCTNCILFKQCGGHLLPIIHELGCVNYANQTQPVDTDDMNPLFEDRFWELWDDVCGLEDYSVGRLRPVEATGLPRYLPLFKDRHMRRSRLLDAPVVALRLFDIIGRRKDGSYAPRYTTASALRTAYKLRQDTRVLLVGVDHDGPLENFWAEHRLHPVGERLADLGLLGVTVPNFSYFTCVPRFQILRNRKRILLAAERLSGAGVRVSPHLNANSEGDWLFWLGFLRDHPEVTTVTMEFQTGSRTNAAVGREAFDQLVALQDRLCRPLHPLLVGAARYYKEAQAKFGAFTVIDSQPFMQAVSRQVLAFEGSRYFWKSTPTPMGAPLDDLIETNILYYEDKLSAGSDDEIECPAADPKQTEWPLETSKPYLTVKPQA